MASILNNVITVAALVDTILAFNCPSPCVCRDSNTTVFCNRTGISEVPKDLPPNTITLNLGYNQITFIASNAFDGLNQLQNLDLSGNQFTPNSFLNGALNISSIRSLDLSSGSYMSIPKGLPPNLSTLYFSYNPITTLITDSFVNPSTIQYLEFQNNQIRKIEDHAFDPLINAIEIDIGFNKLVDGSFSQMAFAKVQKLQHLVLRFNALQTFPNTSYYPSTLQHIDLVGNQFKVVPSYAFRTLTNLQTIEMWSGAVTTVEDNAFYGLHKLTLLDLTSNDFSSTITNLTFADLPALQKLYLLMNKVNRIDPGAFNSMKNIEVILMTSNMLQTLDPDVLNSKLLPALSVIAIDFNPWICDCHLRWLRERMDKEPNFIQNPHLVVCSGPAAVFGKSWDELSSSEFVCKQ